MLCVHDCRLSGSLAAVDFLSAIKQFLGRWKFSRVSLSLGLSETGIP